MRAGKGKRVSSREARTGGSGRGAGLGSARDEESFRARVQLSACSPPTMSAPVACPRSVLCYAYLLKCQ
jgi:hypothetical protein